jgi:hypothetical protein
MPRLLKGLLVSAFALLALGAIPAAEAADHEYVGSNNCRKCHIREYRSWAETTMAKSFEVLKPGERAAEKTAAGLDPAKDYTTDVECVRCHSTGYGKPGGFVDIKSTPNLAGIGCESCHGPGGTYLKDGYMTLENKEYKKADLVAVGLTDSVTEDLCTGCHNTDSPFVGDDYVFDFEANKDQGTHEKFPLKFEH